jgi:hypothetical protein
MRACRRGEVAIVTMLAIVTICVACRGESANVVIHDERTRMKRGMMDGSIPKAERIAAAHRYHELIWDDPEEVRYVAGALSVNDDPRGAIAVLRVLIAQGQATSADRFRAISLMINAANENKIVIDDVMYQSNLAWLRRELEGSSDCHGWWYLMTWTSTHNEEILSIDGALENCKDDWYRGMFYVRRAWLRDSREDACFAIAVGWYTKALAPQCIEARDGGWRVEFAKALLARDEERLASLRRVIAHPDLTDFALVIFATQPGVTRKEACAAISRLRDPDHLSNTGEERLEKVKIMRRDCKSEAP